MDQIRPPPPRTFLRQICRSLTYVNNDESWMKHHQGLAEEAPPVQCSTI